MKVFVFKQRERNEAVIMIRVFLTDCISTPTLRKFQTNAKNKKFKGIYVSVRRKSRVVCTGIS